MGVGNRIEALCADKGLSIRKLALTADVPYSTLYSAIKRNSNRIDLDTLKKIANALGVEWYELLSDDSEEQVEVVKSYIGEKIAKSGIQNDAERTFLIRETINNYYNQLNIDGKLAAYKILFERSEDAVLADSIQDFKALADTPQYQKKAEK